MDDKNQSVNVTGSGNQVAAHSKGVTQDRKRPRLRDPRRSPVTVLETLEDLREMLELGRKQSADEGRTERDKYKFVRIEAWVAAEEAIAKDRMERYS